MSTTWFVTGASRGLGRAFVLAALERGDRVVATARDVDTLADLPPQDGRLLALPLDVTDVGSVREAVRAAVDRFGTLDVVVNNAGAGEAGAVEELSERALRAAMDVNFFGAVAVTQAVLPVLRAQGHGHLVQISSMGGLVGLPLVGAYIASKWALEGLTESLTQEVAGLGIHVTLVEPASYATSQGHGTAGSAPTLDAYEPVRAARAAQQAQGGGPAPGDPAEAAQLLLRVVDAEEPPRRVIFGTGGVEFVEQVYTQRIAGWREAAALIG